MFDFKILKTKLISFFPVELEKKIIAAFIIFSVLFLRFLFCDISYIYLDSNMVSFYKGIFIIVAVAFIAITLLAHLFIYFYSSFDKLLVKIRNFILGFVSISIGLIIFYEHIFLHYFYDSLICVSSFIIYDFARYFIRLDGNAIFSKTKTFFLMCSFVINLYLILYLHELKSIIYNDLRLNVLLILFLFFLFSIIFLYSFKIFDKFTSFYRKIFHMKKFSVVNSLIDVVNMMTFFYFFAFVGAMVAGIVVDGILGINIAIT